MIRARKFSLVLLAGIAFAPLMPQQANAQRGPQGVERALFDAANHDREARGLRPLRWDDALARAAQQHALRMAQMHAISHQFPGEPELAARASAAHARFSRVSENVAEGPVAAEFHAQWMNSPPHRENLLNPELDSVGIAVAEGVGQYYGVEDFSHAIPNLTLAEQEKQVGALLIAEGLHPRREHDDARTACATDRVPGQVASSFSFFRYETADLSKLPDSMLKQVRSARFTSASVGACAFHSDSGFTLYRIGVILF